MTQASGRERLFTTREFDQWWDNRGRAQAVPTALDPDGVRAVAWDAWRTGREQLSGATAERRLQPSRA
jgi:hypothetical protein